MNSHRWADVWKIFLDALSHESVGIQIAIVLGLALTAVMALEGIRASFFPRRIVASMALRDAASRPTLSATPQAERDMAEGFDFTPPSVTVNDDTARRSSPRRMRVLGQRKPS